jgi:2-C-methyl-D-erythritol 4-phosphate cytidylyltransferase
MGREVIAIVPAAGPGKRLGPGANKPFMELLGRPLLSWVLLALEAAEEVSEVIPVLREEDVERGRRLVEEFGLLKVKRVAPGGKERQDSVLSALRLIDDPRATVLVHDGARPLIEGWLITATLKGLQGYDGAVAALPLKDTVKQVDEEGFVSSTPERHMLRAAQTPQAFPFGTLMEACLAAGKEGHYSTDDSALVERRGGRVKVVTGSFENIKITTPEDIAVAEMFLGRRGL